MGGWRKNSLSTRPPGPSDTIAAAALRRDKRAAVEQERPMDFSTLAPPPVEFDSAVWEPLIAASTRGTKEVSVLFRKDSIKLSASFVAMAQLYEHGRVYALIGTQPLRFALQMSFVTERQLTDLRRERGAVENAFKVHHDGGARGLDKRKGSVIQNSAALKRLPWLASASYRHFGLRRTFEPQATGDSFIWNLQIVPGFLEQCPLVDGSKRARGRGVYALTLGEECVYIGRGDISDRLRKHSAVPDVMECQAMWTQYHDERIMAYAENHWLWCYKARYGRLPKFNRATSKLKAVDMGDM